MKDYADYDSNFKNQNNQFSNLNTNAFSHSPFKSPYENKEKKYNNNIEDIDTNFTSNSNFGFTRIPTSAKMRHFDQSAFTQRESEIISNQPSKGFYNSPYETGKRYSKIIPYNSSFINKLVDLILNW